MHRQPPESGQLKQSLQSGFVMREGILAVDVPAAEERITRRFVDDIAVAEVGPAFGIVRIP